MDQERDVKVDAVVAALSDGLQDVPGSTLSDLALRIYACCVVDQIGHHGFKIVKNDA